MSVLLAFLALLIERFTGYPQPLLKAIGHPVMWIGNLISWLDARLNLPSFQPSRRRLHGALALAVIVLIPAAIAGIVSGVLSLVPFGVVLAAVVATSLLAQNSLESHVAAVAQALETGGLEAGRVAVSRIVGRDPDRLDEAGVSRAAIESLAENFSDGIVAPAFWLGVGGLAGGAAYKAVNTADSMIGHRTEKHEDFGWASARFDDLVNLPASRLTALLIACAAFFVRGASTENAWRAVWRDAGKHRSPNAGWPEAAMAGALGLALAGPRVYGGVTVHDATMGAGGRREATAADIRAALKIFRVADWLLIGLFGFLALFLLA
ncbi:adenosylcobinamide-phosphate synthase [Mesorhizobium albiziae]|uniref:Cobalamin biosynthesis protein CobD n=1 Tax=Neomesorhizobium albiziae TaxID=335020 RepID=A0A1I3WAD7_9HYPH|nr:adenosylcobinamide-phosphate synthase CbiB [Mesorhizobium albiziae]GLS31484.1 cobalamin biosynthesis protein CobD [Mesorhizobium albiziae]SFK04528.1 adenosylcobinamide-phosphate synthase [Mesorhizobium albiziae]